MGSGHEWFHVEIRSLNSGEFNFDAWATAQKSGGAGMTSPLYSLQDGTYRFLKEQRPYDRAPEEK
jgi:hypothetical protein